MDAEQRLMAAVRISEGASRQPVDNCRTKNVSISSTTPVVGDQRTNLLLTIKATGDNIRVLKDKKADKVGTV